MSEPLRYVVLWHHGIDEPHFDLMFETSPGSRLATWRARQWPLRTRVTIEHIADHRREYLDYEGPLSGDRGAVNRIARGTHTLSSDHPVLLVVHLDNGQVLRLFRDEKPHPA